MAKTSAPGTPITIKKYANRRLYNTETSSYITLDTLSQMVREGREFVVLDAKSGDDITHNVLTQIIVEGEGRGEQMLPTGFLRQVIAMYGNSMQSMVPGYLEASMEAFRTNQDNVRTAFDSAISGNPFADMAKRNMEIFEATLSAFRPAAPPTAEEEVASLKAKMEELQAQVAKMAK
jgi:polyhydroxyalkanoate synthesis repressor PhaR